jgi:hypothetical protein
MPVPDNACGISDSRFDVSNKVARKKLATPPRLGLAVGLVFSGGKAEAGRLWNPQVGRPALQGEQNWLFAKGDLKHRRWEKEDEDEH